MSDRVGIIALAIDPDGTVREVTLPAGNVLQGLYAAIGCTTVDMVGLTSTLDMWVDDEGLLYGSPQINLAATYLARAYGWTRQPYAGTVVLAEHNDDGDTMSLTATLRAAVLDVLAGF